MSSLLNSRPDGGSRRRRGLVAAAAAALVVSPLAAITPASAVSPNVVISEVYGGNGATAAYGNDFIELYNPTANDVVMNNWSVQYKAAAGNGAFQVTTLNGTVKAGKHFLVQQGNATTGTALPTPDATGSIAMAAGAGVVALVSNNTTYPTFGTSTTNVDLAGVTANGLVDTVGYGTTATTYETSNTASNLTATTSAQRTAAVDSDRNAADFSSATPTPENSGPVAPTALEATSPGNKTGQVGSPITGFTLAATGGTAPYTWSATGLPGGVSVAPNGAVSGTPDATGTFTVTATATDSAATPASDDVSFTFTINAAASLIPIAEIQGTGATTPLNGQQVKTQGVVTAAYPTGGLNGFYIQTPGADTANASDAVFVYGGTSGFATYPAVGDSVQVVGEAAEFSGATQIIASNAGVTAVTPSLGEVTPKTQIPGADCALPGAACLDGAALDEAREVVEGELFKPTAPWTATDVYDGGPYYSNGSNGSAFRGEIGVVSNSTKPLVAPTEIIDAQATAAVAERKKYNDAHRIILDDASSWTYSTTENSDKPFPWFTANHSVRVGSAITFPKPVIFTFGFNAWRILPQAQVVGDPTGTINFTQTRPAAPQNVGGDLKLATFNVLNFFPTTGEEFDAGPGSCTFYTDRAGNRISNNSCTPNGPRGAANEANLARQRDKIVAAINTADADIVSLEELENSVQFGKDRDFAINALVTALNADAGAGTWAAVPSAPVLPTLAEQDVIRNGFIYQPANVALVGESVVLSDESTGTEAFADAREPLAQAFKKVGDADADAFAVIVNHFKSKGSGNPDPNGQGNANDRRVLQANSLVAFADSFKSQRGITRVFLAGDFNAYSEEDPIQVLKAAGYDNLESTSNADEETYNFDGQVGSLDHVLANAAAKADVNAVDIWDINGYESVYYEYARFNTNVTNLYAPNPFRSSDHSPEIVGINTEPAVPAEEEIQILGINDFHGRILNEDGTNGTTAGITAGAAVLSGAVKQLRSENPNTVFAAAGDLIGASTFESFIQKDKPTIDALNEAGLEVSAVGNHELDAGYNDLVNRVMAPYDAVTNPLGGARWKYIAANLRKKSDDSHAVDDAWIKDFGDVQVGFVGAVTEDLPALVSPDGIADIKVTDIVDEVNASADQLEADGADVIVLLIHEGAANTTLAAATDPNSAFGQVVNGVDANIDAIVSGHTHLAYNHAVPVPAWVAQGRAVTTRPVVSAGQYGTYLNQLKLTVDTATGDVLAQTQNVLNLKQQTAPFTANYPADPNVTPIVNDAIAKSNVLGAVELGKIAAPFNRAKLSNGTTENRGGESTLGNLVAEVQRWATQTPEAGGAQIAFMNPGGLRQDMVGNAGGYPTTLTYKQAAVVQPFANTLVNMKMTGAQIKTALEQQWQRDGAGNIPTRPFLRLGTSKGFRYTYDPSRTEGDRITAMWLNGTPIAAGTSYSVTVNSFLGSGGDNFRVFAQGTQKRDTGKIDLQGMVDYMDEFANTAEGDAPLAPDFTQHSVGVAFPAGAPASYKQGDDVTFTLSSLAFSTAPDIKDTSVEVRFGGALLGEAPVDNTIGTAVFDEYGTSTVTVKVPNGAPDGRVVLKVTGNNTGTTVDVPITITDNRAPSTVTVPDVSLAYGQAGQLDITVAPAATGSVEVFEGTTSLGTAPLTNSAATFALAAKSLPVGVHTLRVAYPGDSNVKASSISATVTVTKATSSTAATVAPTELKAGVDTGTISVTVNGESPTGLVGAVLDGQVIGGAELVDGKASIAIGPFAAAGTKAITVRYYGDANNAASSADVSVTVVANPVPEKATPTITATVDPVTLKVKKDSATVSVTVTRPGGTATGSVLALIDNKVVGAGELAAGKTSIVVGPFDTVGAKAITLKYLGDDATKAGEGSTSVTVQKATPKLTVKAPKKLKEDEVLEVSVAAAADGFEVTGQVTAKVKGTSKTKTLSGGEVDFRLGKLTKPGTYEVTITFLGSNLAEPVTKTVEVKVKKDKKGKNKKR
ncbi:ExeM/NucH family extracellular endonuclease [Nocardioides currus]|uniref:ExeM/NucH family extracellular endonuclease n=1 Tax=Nocardioides currus TaxID=2133958 RepID=UPI001402FCED|nr:ExeM/NucH family extracellular endonuclease [Nocardioides currus]